MTVARGICRLFARNDIWALAEMPLRNGRRADLMGIDPKGRIVIVEIKDSARATCSATASGPTTSTSATGSTGACRPSSTAPASKAPISGPTAAG